MTIAKAKGRKIESEKEKVNTRTDITVAKAMCQNIMNKFLIKKKIDVKLDLPQQVGIIPNILDYFGGTIYLKAK